MCLVEAASDRALWGIFEVEVQETWHNFIRKSLLYEIQGAPVLDEEVVVEHVEKCGIILIFYVPTSLDGSHSCHRRGSAPLYVVRTQKRQ
jgi:hypothetical protein